MFNAMTDAADGPQYAKTIQAYLNRNGDVSGKSRLKRVHVYWWAQVKHYAILLPYLKPQKENHFWLRICGIVVCLLLSRGLNVLLPLEVGQIVTLLSEARGLKLWKHVVNYIFLRFLMSGAGIDTLRQYLWQPIEDGASEGLATAAYKQMMALSSDFHDNKKSSDISQIINRCRSTIFLIYALSFEVIPQVLDLLFAISVFWGAFSRHIASVACISIISYLWTSARYTSKRTTYLRKHSSIREQEQNLLMETCFNWTTVAYFDRFQHEIHRYATAVRSTQLSSQELKVVNAKLNFVRQLTMLLGLAVACLLISHQIQIGERNVADFVVLVTYWSQLTGPLSSFAGILLRVAHVQVEAERLLEFLHRQPSVRDTEGANDLVVSEGLVNFKAVNFSYGPDRQVLEDITFQSESGQTVALVGETGGGKSAILKLLLRMHDTSAGSITIDGQNIKVVTISSLRKQIGIVPQNIGLFNTSIIENVRYGRLNASLDDCKEVCKAAAIHEKILTLADGYDTIVGERGVKLSGGELQRLGLARVLLKDPKIILLDEATSSVDVITESKIQESIKKWTAGRTTFIVAHRLSTIVHADLILVIKNGRVVEQGAHKALLSRDGPYYQLWTKQVLNPPDRGPSLTRSRSWSPSPSNV